MAPTYISRGSQSFGQELPHTCQGRIRTCRSQHGIFECVMAQGGRDDPYITLDMVLEVASGSSQPESTPYVKPPMATTQAIRTT